MKNASPGSETESGQDVVIRDCVRKDLPSVARLAARLVEEHHTMDPERFLIFDRIEEGYQAYLGGELAEDHSVVLVAFIRERVVGYAYGRIEPKDWSILRERCGLLHDVYVDQGCRRRGVAKALVLEMIRRLGALGAPRVILMTAARNETARRAFETLGFRPTMLEMTKECPRL